MEGKSLFRPTCMPNCPKRPVAERSHSTMMSRQASATAFTAAWVESRHAKMSDAARVL